MSAEHHKSAIQNSTRNIDSFAEEFDSTGDEKNILDPQEVAYLQAELSRVQAKHKASLTQYKDLYSHCETLIKESEAEHAAAEALRTENALLNQQVKDLQTAQSETAQQLKQMKQYEQELTKEVESLRIAASGSRIGSERARRLLPGTIRTLDDLSNFIETLMDKLHHSATAGASGLRAKDSLAPKAGKILVEQLKGEIESLKSLNTLLGSDSRIS